MGTKKTNQYLGKPIRDILWKSALDINEKSLYHLTLLSPLEIIANSIHTNQYNSLNHKIKLYLHDILLPIINVPNNQIN